MICINKLKETSKLELSVHVRVLFVSTTCKERTRISIVIVHKDVVV